MRAGTFIVRSLLIAACILLGVVLERRVLAPRRDASHAGVNLAPDNSSGAKTDYPSRAARIVGPPETTIDTNELVHLTSLAEISAAIDAALTNRLFSQRAAALDILAGQIDPALIPETISLLERIPAG